MLKKLKAIVWRDLFKKRWAIIVELQAIPNLPKEVDGEIVGGGVTHVPCVSRLPVKRPFTQSYNEFVNEHNGRTKLVITGTKETLSNLGNLGSVLPHNFKLAEQGYKAAPFVLY